MNVAERLIQLANNICTNNFEYPDYDPDNPIENLADALTIFVSECMNNEDDIDTAEVYDFLNEKLKR